MKKILEIKTGEGLFEALEVVIDGRSFEVKEATLDVLEKCQDLYPRASAGDAKAIRAILEILLKPDQVFGSMTLRQLKKLIDVVVERSMKPDEVEKNAPSSEEAGLP